MVTTPTNGNWKARSARKHVSQVAMSVKEGMQGGGGGGQDSACYGAEDSEWGTVGNNVLMHQWLSPD